MDLGGAQTRNLLEGADDLELSFVELIVAASECSEDEGEIFDLVDGLMLSDRIQLSNDTSGQNTQHNPALL